MPQYWWGAQDTFLLTLYNFRNIAGGGEHVLPWPPYSAVPGLEEARELNSPSTSNVLAAADRDISRGQRFYAHIKTAGRWKRWH